MDMQAFKYNSALFDALVAEVEMELDRQVDNQPDRRDAIESEMLTIQSQMEGWMQSLGNAKLPQALRESIEASYSAAIVRQTELSQQLSEIDVKRDLNRAATSKADIAERVTRLGRLIAEGNTTYFNLELSQHVESIRCFPDRSVVMRTCKLGALPTTLPLFRVDAGEEKTSVSASPTTRRRTRREVHDSSRDSREMDAATEFAVELGRFAGLAERWFWIDEFVIQKRIAWAEQYAVEVDAYRRNHNCTQAELCRHFAKSKPTIRKALKIAANKLAQREGSSSGEPDKSSLAGD